MDQASRVWEPLKPVLRTLYLEQDLSLREVMDEMVARHQFSATKSQYELQFKKWQFRKNCTAEGWKIVAQKLTKRKREQKETEVFLNGNLIHPKKLKKETQRYKALSVARESVSSPPGFSPSTPREFIIRTPSPRIACFTSTSIDLNHTYPISTPNPVLLGYLPFQQFNSVFDLTGNCILSPQNSGESELLALSQDMYSSGLEDLAGRDGGRVSGCFNEIIKALLPQDAVPTILIAPDMAVSPQNPALDLQFLKLTVYLLSNNFFTSTTDMSKKVYKWIKQQSSNRVLEHLLSIGGPTIEALAENIFGLAIDAEDDLAVRELMKFGINPNERVYRRYDNCFTPLEQACHLQSLKLVKTLISGGAKIDHTIHYGQTESLLWLATDGIDIKDFHSACDFRKYVDTKLVKFLINLGASVNPGIRPSPLINAVVLGQVELVKLLLSAGADVNMTSGEDIDGWAVASPLATAIECYNVDVHTHRLSIVRILLNAAAESRKKWTCNRQSEMATILEVATTWKSITIVQMLLDCGARVTERSFINAIKYSDQNVLTLLQAFGAQVTDSVIKSAVKHKDSLVFFLLETADNSAKQRLKAAALMLSIKYNKKDLMLSLSAYGALLDEFAPLPKSYVTDLVKSGDLDVLRFLLDAKLGYLVLFPELLDYALLIAIGCGRNDILDLLWKACSRANIANGRKTEKYELLEAICKRNLGLANRILAATVSGNNDGHWGGLTASGEIGTDLITPMILSEAIKWGDHPLIQSIIDAGAEIDIPESVFDKYPLVLAVEKGDTKCVELLINAGADINGSKDNDGKDLVLDIACRKNDLQMVQCLLHFGADSNDSSLTHAISGSLKIVQSLLQARLHRYKLYSHKYGCEALQHAIILKNAPMIGALLGAKINVDSIVLPSLLCSKYPFGYDVRVFSEVNRTGNSALGIAVKYDESFDFWIIKMLLCGGADLNKIATNDCKTTLLLAIEYNNSAMVKFLLAAGAKANPTVSLGIQPTPLQLAVEKGRMEIIHILLDHGADVNAQPSNKGGATALQSAAIGGYTGVAQLLIRRGADVNAAPAKIDGKTALEGAAEYGRIDMLQLLLYSGALIIGTGSAQYERARELALMKGHRAVVRMLEKYKKDVETFAPEGNMEMDCSGFFSDDLWM